MISGKIKNLFVLVSTPALFYYASQLVAEALQLPGQMRWYQLHGGSIRNFKDFFVIAGYFLISAKTAINAYLTASTPNLAAR